jgi:hypothetical protein
VTAAGRFPLVPGRPLVFRRENGAWGYSCACASHGRRGLLSSDMRNADDWAQALRNAFSHVRFFHVDPLERLFQAPAYERAGGTS